jgi:hypothetical protein
MSTYDKTNGRLTTDRYAFQHHVDGYDSHHKADKIDLNPSLTVNGTGVSTVQAALAAINSNLNLTIPTATSSNYGVIKLTGDLGGTAAVPKVAAIQGYPVSSTAPGATGVVMTWNGSSYGPAAPANNFSAGGDLAGTNISQTVTALTGQSSKTLIRSSSPTIAWDATTSLPKITQNDTTSASGQKLMIYGQTSTFAGGGGGFVEISGGVPGSGGLKGGVNLSLNAGSDNLLKLSEVAAGKRVVSLFDNNTMGANTGDKVFYIGNASTAPSAAAGSGVIMYSENGILKVLGSDGIVRAIGYTLNSNDIISSDGSSLHRTALFRQNVSASSAISPIIYTASSSGLFYGASYTTIRVDVVFEGTATSGNYYKTVKKTALFKATGSPTVTVTQLGSTLVTDNEISDGTYGAAWTVGISNTGNLITADISIASDATHNTNWNIYYDIYVKAV